jgi:hypothetical protein
LRVSDMRLACGETDAFSWGAEQQVINRTERSGER